MKRNALNYIRKISRNWKPVTSPYYTSEEATEAYRLYILSLAGQPEMGAMNRLKEASSLTDVSRWLLASSYALVGRKDVAVSLAEQTREMTAYESASDLTFGSQLRNESICLTTLCLLDKGNEAAVIADRMAAELSSDEWLSTQSVSFALVALSDYMKKYPTDDAIHFTYTCSGKEANIGVKSSIWSETLLNKATGQLPLEVKNTGKSTLFVRILAEGQPAQGEIAPVSEGLSLAVSYVDEAGRPVDVSQLQQGTNFTAVVTVKNPSAEDYAHLVVTELFPAGWEILNTRFLNEGAANGNPTAISYQDVRDDRVYSYIDRLPAGRQAVIRIHLCAVYAGRFYLPPVSCEAMYNNRLRANSASRFVTVK